MTRGYLAYRCPLCGDQCGNDANAGWDVVTQQSVLLSEFDDQWCGECGEVTFENIPFPIPPRSPD
jgi:ribosomal protein S27AE